MPTGLRTNAPDLVDSVAAPGGGTADLAVVALADATGALIGPGNPLAVTGGGGGGGGGAVTLADGAHTTFGSEADAAATTDTGSFTFMAFVKRFTGFLATLAGTVTAGRLAVSGTFWQATQPVSAATLPLPTGASTEATLASVLAKLTADPATQTTLAAVLAKLTSDPATQTTLAAVLAKLSADPATQTTLAAVLAVLTAGQKASSASLSVATSKDQDPIFDHVNGTKTGVTTSATIITPPAGCNYLRISSDVDIFVNTAGSTAVDDGTSIRIVANVPEVIPVVAGTLVKALSSSGTATVRCTPLKTR